MKVLEPGKSKELWTIQHRCTGWGGDNEGCDALLEIDWNDLRYRPGYFDEKCDCNPTVCFKCPCCDQVTYLGMNDWPTNHRNLPKWTYDWHFTKTNAA